MRRGRWVAVTLLIAVAAAAGVPLSPLHAQFAQLAQLGRQVLVVQPTAADIPIGSRQAFQLLDMSGRRVPAEDWTLTDSSVATLTIEQGRAIVTAQHEGVTTLVNRRGARSDAIRVVPRTAGRVEARWLLRPVDGRFTKVLASTVAGGSMYYYEDRGRVSAHIRAVAADGLQQWQWPPPQSGGTPTLLAVDRDGGPLLLVQTRDIRELVSLGSDGQERWRVAAPGLNDSGVGFTGSGGVLFVTDTGTIRRLIGVDGSTGKQELAVLLDAGQSVQRNFSVQAGGFVCTPGVIRTDPLPLRATPVVTAVRGVASLASAEWVLTADAGACGAGTRLDVSDIRVMVRQRIVLLDVDARFSLTRQIVEEGERTTHGNERGIIVIAPLPALASLGDGAMLLPLRRLTRDWLTGDERPLGDAVLRLAAETRKRIYEVPLPATPVTSPVPSLLIGDSGRTAFVAFGTLLLSFDLASGQERWRWTAPRGSLQAVSPMKGDAVLVRHDGRFIEIEAGQLGNDIDESEVLFGLRALPVADPQLRAADPRAKLTLRREPSR